MTTIIVYRVMTVRHHLMLFSTLTPSSRFVLIGLWVLAGFDPQWLDLKSAMAGFDGGQ
jgi:hypothetical protein